MSKYIFNEIFKEIIDTYYIDSNVLGTMIDRDSSRIRHYKTDSRPGKIVLDQLIQSICQIITEKADHYTNDTLRERLNNFIRAREVLAEDIRAKLFEIEEINTYIAFLLRKCLDVTVDAEKLQITSIDHGCSLLSNCSIITKVNQAHQYFENNLYQEAIETYEAIIDEPMLSELLPEKKIVYTDLGLIYRNLGFSQYDYAKIQKSISYLKIASKTAIQLGSSLENALINKYMGTLYTFLFHFEDSEKNLKQAIEYYDASLSEFMNLNNLEEYAKVLINYGVLYIYYADIRNTRNFLKNSISYLDKAISHFNTPDNSYFRALAYKNISGAYSLLAEICNTQTNATQAIEAVQNALKVFTIEDFPVDYAQCVSNLGHTHYIMATTLEPISNCNKAINYINHALSIVPEEIDANAYCIAHLNLSAIYTLLSEHVNKQENMAKALDSLEKCRKYYQVKSGSMNQLKSNINYAAVLIEIGDANLDTKLTKEAETIFMDILMLCDSKQFSYYKAVANYYLARIQYTYYRSFYSMEHADTALTYLKNALLTFNINDYPLNYAHSMKLSAKIYEHIKDYTNSKQAYENMLRIFTREKYPDKYQVIIEEYNELMKLTV